jgi:hypothetical protein
MYEHLNYRTTKSQRALQCIPVQDDRLWHERAQEADSRQQPMGKLLLLFMERVPTRYFQDDWVTLWTWVEPSSSLLAEQHPTLQMQRLCLMVAASSA